MRLSSGRSHPSATAKVDASLNSVFGGCRFDPSANAKVDGLFLHENISTFLRVVTLALALRSKVFCSHRILDAVRSHSTLAPTLESHIVIFY